MRRQIIQAIRRFRNRAAFLIFDDRYIQKLPLQRKVKLHFDSVRRACEKIGQYGPEKPVPFDHKSSSILLH